MSASGGYRDMDRFYASTQHSADAAVGLTRARAERRRDLADCQLALADREAHWARAERRRARELALEMLAPHLGHDPPRLLVEARRVADFILGEDDAGR